MLSYSEYVGERKVWQKVGRNLVVIKVQQHVCMYAQ